jgi:hypothetical protein
MQIGSVDPVTEEILALGFDVQSSIKLLGVNIDSNCSNYTATKSMMEEKVISQVRFWQRFSLSLPGRISVSKTFMYSQLNYIGCFLPMEQDLMSSIENRIEEYVKGPLNISKERMTLPREEGGLGLFKISTFLGGQACAWAKRAQTLDDNWKLRLLRGSLGNVLNLREGDFCGLREPILKNIAKNMEELKLKLTGIKKTILRLTSHVTNSFSTGGKNGNPLMKNFLA